MALLALIFAALAMLVQGYTAARFRGSIAACAILGAFMGQICQHFLA